MSAAVTSCEASAQKIVDRFDEFLGPYADNTPQEFLEAPQLAGLDSFQNDVAEIIVQVATDPNDDCTERDLQGQVDLALESYAGQGLLNQYLVGEIRHGFSVEQRDVALTPDDDLITILPLLGPGSSITLSEGVFDLDATVLVQAGLVVVGAGRDLTVINSSADTAAFAVLGDGALVMNNLTVRHVGDSPASVLLAVDASLELVRVGVYGGLVDDDGAGGSGIVLTASANAPVGAVTVSESIVGENEAAGIAVTGPAEPKVLESVIDSNAQCGICYFDDSGGRVQATTLSANGVGLQASGASVPQVAGNMFIDNVVAGMLIEDDSQAIVVDNQFEGVGTVGIDVQGEAAPVLQHNDIGPHAVAISLRGDSTASVSRNITTGGDIAILVGGAATPMVFENLLSDTEVSTMLHTGTSRGEFVANVIGPSGGAGIVVEGDAAPLIDSTNVEGGLVGIVFREQALGLVAGSTFTGQQVGAESGDRAAPTIEFNTFSASTEAAVIFSGQGTSVFRDNLIDQPLAIGVQASGSGDPLIERNTIQGGDTAVLVTEQSRAHIQDNTLIDQNFGIGISGTAAPVVDGNEIRSASAGAISFEGASSGRAANNMILDAGVVGIRVAGAAKPTLEANMLFAVLPQPASSGSESDQASGAETTTDAADDLSNVSGAGLLYADTGGGTAELNQVFGFVIGIQVSDDAAPDLLSNRVDGAGVGGVGILYGLNGSGTADENLSINQELGFQLSGSASPVLTTNTVESAAVAAFLIQGESTARLDHNTCPDSQVGIVVLEQAVPELKENDCPRQ